MIELRLWQNQQLRASRAHHATNLCVPGRTAGAHLSSSWIVLGGLYLAGLGRLAKLGGRAPLPGLLRLEEPQQASLLVRHRRLQFPPFCVSNICTTRPNRSRPTQCTLAAMTPAASR